MLVLRFGNPMFGAVWDCNHIDNVQVIRPHPELCLLKVTKVLDIDDRGQRHRGSRRIL